MTGHLKLYLGYAAGVGKTFQMLTDAQDLRSQGRDVVVGYFESHGRQDTIAVTEGLEIIPRRTIQYRGATFEEMDTDAIVNRAPEVCLVDEFAHTNVPGSPRAKRWEDVRVLLDHGIDVFTTMNIQHLESVNDQIFHISGIRVRETIPDWVMAQADDVVMVDLTPEALLNRLKRGAVYAPDKTARALENFFREPTLVALREMALRQTAHEVDIRQAISERDVPVPSRRLQAHERLLLHITADPSTAALIRRGRRLADFLQADSIAVAVERSTSLDTLAPEERSRLSKHLEFARNLHIDTRILESDDPAAALIDFARANKVTQILISRPARSPWTAALGRSVVQRVVQLAREMRVTVVADRTRAAK
ncbi:MAG: histidine kinase [Acidobacteria bacterium]|nr:histidine kinase [Acidobacteriota bacterium]